MSEINESIPPSEQEKSIHTTLTNKTINTTTKTNKTNKTNKTSKTSKTAESSNTIYSITADTELTREEFIEDLQSIDAYELGEKIHVYAPRKSGYEIAPGIERLMKMLPRELKYHQKYFQIFMQRHRLKNIEKHLYHLQHFDDSDKIIPHGEISKKIYNDILALRNFDSYARPLYLSEASLKAYHENHRKYLLGKKYRYTRPPDESEKIRKEAIPVFDHDLPVRKQKITTEPWKVGVKDVYNPPVGFAKTPGNVLKSEGREGYYSYDGEWKDGKMHGEGHYLFSDGKSYKGYFKDNNCDGHGYAEYPIGSVYDGEWKNGKFHGDGILSYAGGTHYEGHWKYGKRDGKGILTLPCGLIYEGDFQNGVPHGRGRMTSKLTGYVYEGSFEKGSIEGSGTLITPPPNSERIVRYWPHSKDGMTLSGLIRLLIEERKSFYQTNARNKEIMFAPKRKLFLNDYVQKVRTELHERRAIEKREKLNQQMQQIKDQKEKMRQAKLKALGGYDDDDNDSYKKEDSSSDSDSEKSDS